MSDKKKREEIPFQNDLDDMLSTINSLKRNELDAILKILRDSRANTSDKVHGEILDVPSLPEAHVIPNNKLANTITKDVVGIGEFELLVSGKSKKKITNSCVITYEGSDNLVLSSKHPFTEYDRQIHNAVVSLFLNGNDKITAAMVYRAICATPASEFVSPKQIESISKSIDKMRFINVRIDISDELRQRNIIVDDDTVVKKGIIESYLLNMDKVEFEYENADGKNTVIGYKINKVPVLYAYSSLVRQIITVPTLLLEIKDENNKRLRNNEARITIKGFLLRRIGIMKGKTKQSSHILFEEICKLFPETTENYKTRRYKEYAIAVLDYWKKTKYISGYSLLYKKGAFYGFEIDYGGVQ